MVIPPPKPPRITQFLKPYVLKMHFPNKHVHAQVIPCTSYNCSFVFKLMREGLKIKHGINLECCSCCGQDWEDTWGLVVAQRNSSRLSVLKERIEVSW